MAEKAHVTSVEALESFRANLIIYLSKARPALEEVSSDVTRTRIWLENEQRVKLEGLVRRRSKELEQAQQAMFSARIANLRETTDAEQKAVHKAKRALDEAEAKLKVLKQWNREFDSRVDPLAKQLGKLHTVLAKDMVEAVAYLTHAVDSLQAYADISPTAASTGAAPSGDPATTPSTESPAPTAGQPDAPQEKS